MVTVLYVWPSRLSVRNPSASSGSLLLDDCESPTEDDDSDFTELDEESFTPLLLDFLSPWRFEELTGSTELLELDCFTFSLLDEASSAGSAGSPTLSVTMPLLDDDSTPGSSFCPAEADDESSHAARNANNTEKNK